MHGRATTYSYIALNCVDLVLWIYIVYYTLLYSLVIFTVQYRGDTIGTIGSGTPKSSGLVLSSAVLSRVLNSTNAYLASSADSN